MSKLTTSKEEVRRVSRSVDEAGAACDNGMILGPNREELNIVMSNVDNAGNQMFYSDVSSDEGEFEVDTVPTVQPLFPEHHKYSPPRPTVYRIRQNKLVPVKGRIHLDIEAATKAARETQYNPVMPQSYDIQTHHSPFFFPDTTQMQNDAQQQQTLREKQNISFSCGEMENETLKRRSSTPVKPTPPPGFRTLSANAPTFIPNRKHIQTYPIHIAPTWI